jgi:hypothetical protein
MGTVSRHTEALPRSSGPGGNWSPERGFKLTQSGSRKNASLPADRPGHSFRFSPGGSRAARTCRIRATPRMRGLFFLARRQLPANLPRFIFESGFSSGCAGNGSWPFLPAGPIAFNRRSTRKRRNSFPLFSPAPTDESSPLSVILSSSSGRSLRPEPKSSTAAGSRASVAGKFGVPAVTLARSERPKPQRWRTCGWEEIA